MKSIHDKFSSRTAFINLGLAIFSGTFAARAAMGGYTPRNETVIEPVVAFAISAIIALLGVFVPKNQSGYTIYRDGLPVLVFSACLLLAGIQDTWVWLVFAFSVFANIYFAFAAGKNDLYDEEKDKISIYFRWPF